MWVVWSTLCELGAQQDKDSRAMENNLLNTIHFDILLRSAGSGKTPDVSNIDQFRPPPENIEKCRCWLASKRITCHSTDFGLACSASVELFETLFSTKVKRSGLGPGMPPWHCSSPPKGPREIEEYIDQISISAPPELY